MRWMRCVGEVFCRGILPIYCIHLLHSRIINTNFECRIININILSERKVRTHSDHLAVNAEKREMFGKRCYLLTLLPNIRILRMGKQN